MSALIVHSLSGFVVRSLQRAQTRSRLIWKLCRYGASLLRNRDSVIAGGLGKGLRINVGNSHSGFVLGTHKPDVQNAFSLFLKPGMNVIDAGANIGFYSILAAKLVGSSGSVTCFEPLPSNAEKIIHNAKLNGFKNIAVRREALGATDGSARFITSKEPTWGSLEASNANPSAADGSIDVTLRRLDSVMSDGACPLPDLIKIDVEGAENDLLAGAAETIRRSRPVLIMELHGTNIPIARALEELNYQSVILGQDSSIEQAHWNAYVLSVPAEHAHQVKAMRNIKSLVTRA